MTALNVSERPRCDNSTDAVMHASADKLYALLATSASVWLLAYYAIPNTVFARISPGGLLMELDGTRAALVGPASALLFVLVVALTMSSSRRARAKSKCPPLWLVTLVFAAPLIGVCAEKAASTYELQAASVLTAVSVGLLAARLSPGGCAAALSVVASAQAVYAIFYQKEQVNQLLSGTIRRAGGTFNEPNQLYTLMIVALPFAVAGVVTSKGGYKQFACLAAASVELSALMLSYSRAGIVAAACGLAILAIVLMPGRLPRLCIAMLLLTACTAVIAVRTSGPTNAISAGGSNRARIRQWKAGWDAFTSNPLTGVGVGNFRFEMEQQSAGGSIVNVVNQPKNIIIAWLAERGIAGGALFAMFVIAIVVAVRRSLPSPTGAATMAAWISLLAAGMVDTLIGPPNRYAGNCAFGLLIGLTSLLPQAPETAPRVDVGSGDVPSMSKVVAKVVTKGQ